ncbi:MAG: hypothetical protein IK117_06385 [Bacteroidales bacterium]|nr:hypothetical protein [Bacteroidales bacterium]
MKHFADILKAQTIDVDTAYKNLHYMFYQQTVFLSGAPLYHYINKEFCKLNSQGNSISLDDFDKKNNLHFFSPQKAIETADLVLFCEYLTFFCRQTTSYKFLRDAQKQSEIILKQIKETINLLHYQEIKKDGVSVYVPQNPETEAAVEFITENNLKNELLFYNHPSLKGNLDEKSKILNRLANDLEPKRGNLKSINKKLETDIFSIFNNCNIRHNNITPEDAKKYNQKFASLDDCDKEKIYDYVYRCCLIAYIELQNAVVKEIVTKCT